MITIPVALARSCLAVFRRLPTHRSRDAPRFGVAAGPGGLWLRFQGISAAVELHHPEPCPEAAFCLPVTALDAPAGSPAVLDPSAGSPADDVPRFPPWPGGHADNDPELILALAD